MNAYPAAGSLSNPNNAQIAFDNDKRLVRVFMVVPDKVTLQLHDLE